VDHPLNIFIPHCSGLLTDEVAHGDGLVAYGFIKRLAERGHRLYVAAEKVELAKPLHPNVTIFPIRARRANSALNRIEYMLQVRSLFKGLQERIQFNIVHQLNPVYTGVSLALWGSKIPLVLGPYVADWPHDPHAMAARAGLRTLLRQLKNLVAFAQQRQAYALLLTTEAARQRVIGGDRRQAPIHFLPHGVDSDFFSPATSQRSGIANDTESPVILFYANISERKGIFDLLQAFEMVAKRFSEVQLWVAGAGEALASAKDAASQLMSRRRIHFLGAQNHQQALDLLRKADIYCLPSHGEPFGMTVAEAMSCGLPVVVTDGGGLGCIVDDNGGYRVPVRKPRLLADALSLLLDHPDNRAAMGAYNRSKVLATLTWNKVIDGLQEVYRAVLREQENTRGQTEARSNSWIDTLPKRGERV
jgi:glycosyltransferase involved in cell wall biosynthesis